MFVVVGYKVQSLYSFGSSFQSKFNCEVFLNNVAKYHGLPRSIADRNKISISKFWKGLFNTMGTPLNESTI